MKKILFVLGACALADVASGAAQAAPVPGPSTADVAAARQAATDSLGTLGRFFASRNGTVHAVNAVDAARTIPRLTGPTVPVYDLNPDFVRGRSGTVAVLVFLATPAAAPDGRTASLWTAHTASGWKVVNIASGTDEESYGATSGLVFREPQINAWYTLRDGRVLPLNAEARQSLRTPLTLADYQRLVQRRYGDKLPGSTYERKGMAGGYGALGSASRTPASSDATPLLLLLGGTAVAAGGLTVTLRLRRHLP